MTEFTCNICGSQCSVAELEWETPSCLGCGSNIRLRAIMAMLSRELFGKIIPLPDFPVMRNIKGFGLSDHPGYAIPLAEKFDYVNTYYDREPFLDITAVHPDLYGTYDFILSSDVLEHVPMPVERSLDEMYKLLQPNGFLCITVPSLLDETTVEHFPNLYHHAIVKLGDERVLVNRRSDGRIEVHEKLVFHGGPGATLEMRVFSQKDLIRRLQATGFANTSREEQGTSQLGIVYDHEWTRPMVARKGQFVLPEVLAKNQPGAQRSAADPSPGPEPQPVAALASVAAVPVAPTPPPTHSPMYSPMYSEDADVTATASRIAQLEMELRAVRDARWVKLGNRLGLGPRVRSV